MPLILTRCLQRKYSWWLQPPEELYKAMHSCAFGLPLSVVGQLITHHTGAKSRVWNNNVVSVLIWCCQRDLRAVSPQHPFQNCSPTGIQTESLIHWTKTSNGKVQSWVIPWLWAPLFLVPFFYFESLLQQTFWPLLNNFPNLCPTLPPGVLSRAYPTFCNNEPMVRSLLSLHSFSDSPKIKQEI